LKSLLKIGLSASFLHKDPARPLYKNKTLLYFEQTLAHWIHAEGALCILIPTKGEHGKWSFSEVVHELDGLLLQGGADLSPKSYGEEPLRSEWSGDPIRDEYEIELLKECLAQDKPILGVCRGCQLINVALGGTLYQDIQTQAPGSLTHRNWEIYDQNFHEVKIERDSRLSKIYGKTDKGFVCSIHHQAVKDLGNSLTVEARSSEDGIVEAIRHTGHSYVMGVQWHPEFHCSEDPKLLNSKPLLQDFLAEARRHREEKKR
jgi:putative glutamine amidotransferase